ncbi:MAG: type 1 glutamine amidotransferase [Yoonia sp.]|jgi:type 1 glutamine amidotransferase
MNQKLTPSLYRLLLTAALIIAVHTQPTEVAAAEKKFDRSPKNLGSVLVFSGTGWYRHPEVPALSGWLARRDKDLRMQVDVSENPADLVKILNRYKVLVLNNCTEMPALLDEKQRQAVEEWHAAGGGIVALHAALVRQTEWKWFNELAGCDFDSDSEFLEAWVVVDPAAAKHPTVSGHGTSFKYTADWTNHDRSVSGINGFQVLLRVDESSYEPVRELFQKRGGKAMGKDHPIAWLNTNGGGRFFYTELGHDVRSLETPFGKQHIVEAIRWAAGLKPTSSK